MPPENAKNVKLAISWTRTQNVKNILLTVLKLIGIAHAQNARLVTTWIRTTTVYP